MHSETGRSILLDKRHTLLLYGTGPVQGRRKLEQTKMKKSDRQRAARQGGRGVLVRPSPSAGGRGANWPLRTPGTPVAASAVVTAIETLAGRRSDQSGRPDAAASKPAVEKTAATFGQARDPGKTAGTAIPKPFEEGDLAEMDRVLDIKRRGVYVATQASAEAHEERGCIISIGSAVGETRSRALACCPYAERREPSRMFPPGAGQRNRIRGITVNNVQPGPMTRVESPHRVIGGAAAGSHSSYR